MSRYRHKNLRDCKGASTVSVGARCDGGLHLFYFHQFCFRFLRGHEFSVNMEITVKIGIRLRQGPFKASMTVLRCARLCEEKRLRVERTGVFSLSMYPRSSIAFREFRAEKQAALTILCVNMPRTRTRPFNLYCMYYIRHDGRHVFAYPHRRACYNHQRSD